VLLRHPYWATEGFGSLGVNNSMAAKKTKKTAKKTTRKASKKGAKKSKKK
jgi:hypothetical protein